MSVETMSEQSGRGFSKSAMFLAGLVAMVTLFSSPQLRAAGGDNDSPYNMPRADGGTGSGGTPPPLGSHDGSDRLVAFRVATGGDAQRNAYDSGRAALNVPAPGAVIVYESGGSSTHEPNYAAPTGTTGVQPEVIVADGEQVDLRADGGNVKVQGVCEIQGGVDVGLLPSDNIGQKFAILALGTSVSGTALDTIEYVTLLAMPDGSGINLSLIAERLARCPRLHGKTASILMLNATPESGTPPTIEATATFRVGPNFSARIDIDDA